MFFLMGLIIGLVVYFVWNGNATKAGNQTTGSPAEKIQLSGWDNLGNLVWFVVKCLLILWLLYWVLWVLVVSAFFYNINEYAKTPEGQEIIKNNPYNHIEPVEAPAAPAVPYESAPTQQEEEVEREGGDAPLAPEPAEAPAAPASPYEAAPTQQEQEEQYNESDYNG